LTPSRHRAEGTVWRRADGGVRLRTPGFIRRGTRRTEDRERVGKRAAGNEDEASLYSFLSCRSPGRKGRSERERAWPALLLWRHVKREAWFV